MSRERTSSVETRRLFVGVFPPAAAVGDLGRVVDELQVSQGDKAAARLTLRDGWHLTLAFLGSVPVDRLADTAAAVDRAAASAMEPDRASATDFDRAATSATDSDRSAAAAADSDAAADGGGAEGDGVAGVDGVRREGSSGELVVRLAGGGSFGGEGHQILWVGVTGDVAGLVRLADTVRRELAAVDVVSDGRDFRAHLTITRPGVRVSPDAVAADLETLADYAGPQWMPTELCLVASDTGLTEFGRRSRYTTVHKARIVSTE